MAKTNNFITIYLLTNNINYKVYVGQTWLQLKFRMGKDGSNYKNSLYLYNAIKKYRVENFEYSVLGTTTCQVEANELESKFIEEYGSRNPLLGYNIKEGGSNGKHSEASKEKSSITMTEMAKNRPADYYNCHIGNKYNLGKERTQEYKDQKSKEMIKWHADNPHPFLGCHHEDEAKKAMSDKLKGRKVSPEALAKRARTIMIPQEEQDKVIADYLGGMIIKDIMKKFNFGSAKRVYKILGVNNIPPLNNFSKGKGKKRTEESKKKMSEIKQKYWDNLKKELKKI